MKPRTHIILLIALCIFVSMASADTKKKPVDARTPTVKKAPVKIKPKAVAKTKEKSAAPLPGMSEQDWATLKAAHAKNKSKLPKKIQNINWEKNKAAWQAARDKAISNIKRKAEAKLATYAKKQKQETRSLTEQLVKSVKLNPSIKPQLPDDYPVIESLSIAESGPGYPVAITGRGFTHITKVFFSLPANPGNEAQTQFLSQNLIVAVVPDTGVSGSDVTGKMYVKNGNTTSNRKDFLLKPPVILQPMMMDKEEWNNNAAIESPLLDSGVYTAYTPSDDDSWFEENEDGAAVALKLEERLQESLFSLEEFYVKHGYPVASSLLGADGDDIFWEDFRLKNGWVVDSIDIEVVTPPVYDSVGHEVRIEDEKIGTDRPYLKTRWWFEAPGECLGYTVQIWIKGIRGVPYK